MDRITAAVRLYDELMTNAGILIFIMLALQPNLESIKVVFVFHWLSAIWTVLF